MEKKFNFVYVITNKVNGKQYVGDHSTDELNDNYLGSGTYIKHAIKKYGKDFFYKEIVEHFENKEIAFNAQEKYIQKYNTLTPNGYNISPSGGFLNGGNHSKESRKKISESMKGKKHTEERCEKQRKSMIGKNKGKIMTEEQKEKLRLSNLGKIHREETKEKMSNSHKGLFKGYKHNEISKKNMSEAHKGIKQTEESKQKRSAALKLHWAKKEYNKNKYLK